MRINPILNQIKPLSFSSSRRTTYRKEDGSLYTKDEFDVFEFSDGKIVNSNSTWFFREDFFDERIVSAKRRIDKSVNLKRLTSLFPKGEKVNVYNFACSDGSEPYSFAVALMELLGDEAKNYFPIIASDIDSQVLPDKNCLINVSYGDAQKICEFSNNRIKKYFSCSMFPIGNRVVKPRKNFQDTVKFKKEDMALGVGNINTKNNIVIIRNVWPYLSKEQLFDLCKNLAKLDESSYVVIGSFDFKNYTDEYWFAPTLLKECGFEPISDDDVNLIWKKIPSDEFDFDENHLKKLIYTKLHN